MAYQFKWSATFLNSSVSPLSVRGELGYRTTAELASKIAWAIGTTLELPYRKHTTLREDCSFLAAFITENLNN